MPVATSHMTETAYGHLSHTGEDDSEEIGDEEFCRLCHLLLPCEL